MTILSSETIKDRIQRRELVPGGVKERVSGCGYDCTAGKVFSTGERPGLGSNLAKDWTGVVGGGDSYQVKPGDMVWVRTRDAVKLPADIWAFWWQTNSQSRKGLMLVNMSMVPPGYQGMLACLFVNFGKDPVLLTPSTVVARLVFAQLDRGGEDAKATGLLDKGSESVVPYDNDVHEAALRAPASFLGVGQLARDLDQDFARHERNLSRVAAAAISRGKEELGTAADGFRKSQLDELQKDAKGFFTRSIGWAGLALGLLTLASLASNWILTRQKEATSELDLALSKAVEREVAKRMVLGSSPAGDMPAWAEDLKRRIDGLNARVEELKSE
jgi:deoxycytidine triphosphate deaminase